MSTKDTKYQLERQIGELQGSIYWHGRGTFLVENVEELKEKLAVLEKRLEDGDYVPELNERGNTIARSFHSTERYLFDFQLCSREKGWEQYDTSQDAWYFGVWVHPEKREIVTYAEGDITQVVCPTEESYHAELASMAEFYGDPPPAFTVISCEEKTITKVYDERPV